MAQRRGEGTVRKGKTLSNALLMSRWIIVQFRPCPFVNAIFSLEMVMADVVLLPALKPYWDGLYRLLSSRWYRSQKKLAEALEIELPSLMRTLSQLEDQSLITRHCCESDKRARIVGLTPEGKKLLKQMETRIVQVRGQLLIDIKDEEMKKLSHILDQIAHNALDALSEKSETLK